MNSESEQNEIFMKYFRTKPMVPDLTHEKTNPGSLGPMQVPRERSSITIGKL